MSSVCKTPLFTLKNTQVSTHLSLHMLSSSLPSLYTHISSLPPSLPYLHICSLSPSLPYLHTSPFPPPFLTYTSPFLPPLTKHLLPSFLPYLDTFPFLPPFLIYTYLPSSLPPSLPYLHTSPSLSSNSPSPPPQTLRAVRCTNYTSQKVVSGPNRVTQKVWCT